MQDRVDYLSDKKRLDFLDWKEGILKRIEALERQGAAPDDMDTSG
jgi:origin recognition complex subunit 6